MNCKILSIYLINLSFGIITIFCIKLLCSFMNNNGPVDHLGGLVVIAPARRAGDLCLNPGPGENFSLKLLIYDSSDGYSES